MASPLHPEPADLVRRCVTGDDSARAEFISVYDGLIRRAIARRIHRTASPGANAAHVDDIANEVYIRLFANGCRALHSLKDARRLSAWLVTVSQNQAITYLRKIGAPHMAMENEALEQTAPYDQSPDRVAMSNELAARISGGLARLDDKDRLVLQLFYLYNLRYADIADTMGLNINTVASRISRAKQKLRELLEKKGP